MRFPDLAATKLVTLLGLATLLAGTSAGCQCCAWTERYMDCVDHVSDHEGRAEVLYHPGYDLTRIGRADWPWRWCRRCRTAHGFVYETPVTNRVMARMHAQEHAPDEVPPTLAPPPLLPDDLWVEPDSSIETYDEDIGIYPLGPMFDFEDETAPGLPDETQPGVPPVDPVPPSPLPRESDAIEAREPTPAASQSISARGLDREARDAALMNSSGVVRLFDDGEAGRSSPGITVHSVDQNEFGPISMESWLSDQPLGETGVETVSATSQDEPFTAAQATRVPPWAASAHPEVEEPGDDVVPSSGSELDSGSHQTERAEWWQSQPARASDQPTDSSNDDVFGPVPFAEWQSALE